MKKIKIFVLKALRKIYEKVFSVNHREYDRGVTDPDKASQIIYDLLASGKPCMVARYGSTEMFALTNYLGVVASHHSVWKYIQGKQYPWWWEDNVKDQMTRWSGFFPSTEENLMRFGEMMLEDSKLVDVLGSWLPEEKNIKATFSLDYQSVDLKNIEPFWSQKPWSQYLEGKRVVVVHPFADSIKTQYDNKRDKLFVKAMVLPEFASLRVVKAVQSLGGNSSFNNWFEAFDSMEKEIDKEDYDVCLIGCGAYGFPLAAHVKRMGKQAVHFGGALQLLFGIRGNRWDEMEDYKNLINSYWIRPSQNETPQIKDSVENGCYW